MKILALKSKGIIAPHVMDGFIKAFSKLGHEVVTFNINNTINQNNVNDIINFKPDLAIGYGLNGLISLNDGYLLRLIKVPLVLLHYDNSLMYISKEMINEFMEYPSFYYHFMWDPSFLRIFWDYGIRNSFPIALATDPDLFHPNVEVTSESSIAFVGSINLDNLNSLTTNSEEMNHFVDGVIKEKLQTLSLPVLDICFKLFRDKQYKNVLIMYQNNRYQFWSVIYYLIHARGSSIVRHFVLSSIEEIDVHIYGGNSNWDKENIKIHNHVSYGSELSCVYQKHKLNLNINSFQLEKAVNNRIFDCFASKAFVLSDYREDMKNLFPYHWEKISFNNLNELGVKGEYFLTNENERKEIINDLFNIVIKKHTYENRVQEILELIK